MRSELAKAKTDVKNFGKVSEGALDAFGSALGVNVGKIKDVSSAIQGMGQKMTQSSSEAVKGLGSMLKGVNALQAGVAGIAVGTLIAGFKALKAEAENFSNTIDGLNMKMAQEAWISTYRQAMHDNLRGVGQETAEQLNKLERNWKSFTTTIGNAFTGSVAKLTDIGWDDALGLGTNGIVKMVQATSEAVKANRESVAAANEAYKIGKKQGALTQEELASRETIKDLDAKIAEYRLDMVDPSLTLVEREKALAAAKDAIAEKYRIELSIATRMRDLQVELNSLAENGVGDTTKEADLKAKVKDLERAQAQELKALSRESRRLTTEAGKQNAEYLKQLETIKAIKQSRQDLAAWGSDITTPSSFATPQATIQVPAEIIPQVDKDNFQYLFDQNIGFATIKVGVEMDQSKLHDISEQVQSVVEGLATSLSEDIGGLIGDLVTGGEAWGNFATAAMSSFADMAQAVGKMAISTGLATIGIKAALESLNGYVAIAAGAALVALGAAVKAGLKNVANGNYSASTNVASGSYATSSSSSPGGFTEREMNIKVTGTLKASGSDLVTVLTNENKRRLATT